MHNDQTARQDDTKVYLIGGGIASLAAAAFLIRDGEIPGRNIVILEQLDRLGGSLDGAGSAEDGYVLCGGRMIEGKYVCTYDLFSSIPTLDGRKTVTREIFDWNNIMQTTSKCRLIRGGRGIDAPEYRLSEEHIQGLERVAVEPEAMLGNSSIAGQFRPSFFETNFWLMWCTTFAFQPWHSAVEFKRYLLRFTHMVAGFNQLHGIMRTVTHCALTGVVRLFQLASASGTHQLLMAPLAAHPQLQRLRLFVNLMPIHPVARPSQQFG